MLTFDPRVQNPLVRVTSNEDRTLYTISWPAGAGGVLGYRVYGGFDPVYVRSLISGVDPLAPGTTSFQFQAPVSPPNQTMYFWVQAVDGVTDPFINNDSGSYALLSSELGAYTPSPYSTDTQVMLAGDDNQYFFEEIRRRAKAVLEDTGEYADVFIRQWTGLPDPTTQSALGLDPNYQGMTRDDNTFGTGFFPGFFPALRVRMRFGALPAALYDFQMPGIRPLQANEAWTNWEPLLHENDLIVRPATGQRYVVSSVAYSNIRGVPVTQRMELQTVAQTSTLYKVTDELVRQKWTQVNAADYVRAGFGVAADSSGGPDYLIFR